MSGGEKGSAAVDENDIWVCKKCGWTYPNPHPSAKHRRNHRRVCKGAAEEVVVAVEQQEQGSSDNVSSEDENQAAAVVVEPSKETSATEEPKKTEESLKSEEQPAAAAESASTDAPKTKAEEPVVVPETVSVTSSGPPPAQEEKEDMEAKPSHEDVVNDVPPVTESTASPPQADERVEVKEVEVSPNVEQVEEVKGGVEQSQSREVDATVEADNGIEEVKDVVVGEEDHSKAVPLPTHEQVAPLSDVQGDSEKEVLQESVPNSSQQAEELSLPQTETVLETQNGSKAVEPLDSASKKEPDTNNSATKVQELQKVPQARRDSWEQLLDADAQLTEQPQEVVSETAAEQPATLPVQTNGATQPEKPSSNGNPFVETPQTSENKAADSEVSVAEKKPLGESDGATASSSTSWEKGKEVDIKPHVALKSLFEDDTKTLEATGDEQNSSAVSTKRNSGVFTKVMDTIRSSPAGKVKDTPVAASKEKDEDERRKPRWSCFICCS